jgi:hypothetical protein
VAPQAPCLEGRLDASETPFRSRGEAKVANAFRRYGIPFLYEHPLLVYDRGRYRIWHPDFMLPTYGGLIVEYAGMPDVPEYMSGIRRKEMVFQRHRIPAVFIYPWDLKRRDWPEDLVQKLNEVYHAHQWRKVWADVLEPPMQRSSDGRPYSGNVKPGKQRHA